MTTSPLINNLPGRNAQVMNFFLALVHRRHLDRWRSQPPGQRGKAPAVHVFNTFFYNKLFSDAKKYGYANVKRRGAGTSGGQRERSFDCAASLMPSLVCLVGSGVSAAPPQLCRPAHPRASEQASASAPALSR